MFKPITHVIYDMDGLLLDTEFLHEQVNQEIAQRYDQTFNTEVKMAIAGRPTLDSARIIVDILQLPITPEEYLLERNQLLYPLYQTAQTLPGAVELIQHFSAHNVTQAIASSSSSKHFALKTVNHQQWLKLIEVTVLGDDPEVAQGKPAPDIFLVTAKRLNTLPENCLVFEDSLAGTKAAIAAGMSVIAIPDPIFDRELFKVANQVLGSMKEFNPADWNLPSINY